MPVNIFICYAREDEDMLKKLHAHLRPLHLQGLIDVWYDRDISPGTAWEQEIEEHLNSAQIVLLLISPDFMNSDYCYGIEMKRALERHESDEAAVIPIILRPVYWRGEPLGKLQALPTDGKPVTDWPNLDSALYNVTTGIIKVVERLTVQPASHAVAEDQRVDKVSSSILQHAVKKPVFLRTLTGPLSPVTSVVISTDGQTLVSGGSHDGTIKVWELPTGKEVRSLIGPPGVVYCVALSFDGQTLVSGGTRDGTIKVWDLPTGREVDTLIGHTATVYSVALSTDGQTLVSGSHDWTIKIWDLPTGREVRTLTGHTSAVKSVTLAANGQSLASGSYDKTIKVWELSTGKEMHTLTGHTDPVFCVVLSADGHTLVSGSYDWTIKVWEM